MGASDFFIGRRCRHPDRLRRHNPRPRHLFLEQRILGHRKTVAVGEGEDEDVGVEDLHGRAGQGVKGQVASCKLQVAGVRCQVSGVKCQVYGVKC